MSKPLILNFPLYTERLKIRFLEENDLQPHFRMMSDPETVRYMYDEPLCLHQALEHLRPRVQSRALMKDGDWVNVAVELRESGEFVGELGLSCANLTNRCYEVGYVFLREFRGKGYAREAVKELLEYTFETLDAHRVTGRLDARNDRSARLLESVGMQKEGTMRETEFVKGEWTDETLYAILEKEWTAQHRSSK